MFLRLSAVLAAATMFVAAAAGPAAAAAAEPADKPAVLSSWTQTSKASADAWYAASQNKPAWAAYAFDWTTDNCTEAPDNPLDFPFARACQRHDFGYRNYRAAGTFAANKSRLDSAFYEDLKRACAPYAGDERTACNGLAWIYYQAVVIFGAPVVTDAELDEARSIRNGEVYARG
jgi:hypothetical protein